MKRKQKPAKKPKHKQSSRPVPRHYEPINGGSWGDEIASGNYRTRSTPGSDDWPMD